jgi:methyl-accepting chemotaxis protein
MSFEERIDRLTARHEALAESVEMLRDRTLETAANLDRLTERVDRLAEQVDRLGDHVASLTATTQLNFDRLTTAMLGLTEHIAGHERRITGLEGRA